MPVLRKLGRRVAGRIARVVGRNELFEQPGERRVQAPLWSGPEPAPPAEPSAVSAPAARPAKGTRPAGVDRLRMALGAGYGLRLVNHWATWCEPCVEELPRLVALHRRFGDRVRFLGVSWDLFDPQGDVEQTVAGVQAFSAEHGLPWPSLVVDVPPETFFSELDVQWQLVPQTWLIAPDGRVLHKVEGLVDEVGAAELALALEAACG